MLPGKDNGGIVGIVQRGLGLQPLGFDPAPLPSSLSSSNQEYPDNGNIKRTNAPRVITNESLPSTVLKTSLKPKSSPRNESVVSSIDNNNKTSQNVTRVPVATDVGNGQLPTPVTNATLSQKSSNQKVEVASKILPKPTITDSNVGTRVPVATNGGIDQLATPVANAALSQKSPYLKAEAVLKMLPKPMIMGSNVGNPPLSGEMYDQNQSSTNANHPISIASTTAVIDNMKRDGINQIQSLSTVSSNIAAIVQSNGLNRFSDPPSTGLNNSTPNGTANTETTIHKTNANTKVQVGTMLNGSKDPNRKP